MSFGELFNGLPRLSSETASNFLVKWAAYASSRSHSEEPSTYHRYRALIIQTSRVPFISVLHRREDVSCVTTVAARNPPAYIIHGFVLKLHEVPLLMEENENALHLLLL